MESPNRLHVHEDVEFVPKKKRLLVYRYVYVKEGVYCTGFVVGVERKQ